MAFCRKIRSGLFDTLGVALTSHLLGEPGNSRYCVDSKRRHHRTRWLMLLYFPQDTPVELGPTAIMPVRHAAQPSPPARLRPWPSTVCARVSLPCVHGWVQGSQYLLRYDMRQHGMNDVKLSDELPCAGPAGKQPDRSCYVL